MIASQNRGMRLKMALRRHLLNPRIHRFARGLFYFAAALMLSAAGLNNYCLPIPMALVGACGGWSAVSATLGGVLGYGLFWGSVGRVGAFWTVAALPVGLVLSATHTYRKAPLLLPSIIGFLLAASGVCFQLAFLDTTPIGIYLIRIFTGAGCSYLFYRLLQGRNPLLEWLGTAVAVFALAQILPVPYLGLGYIAAGMVVSGGTFPAAAISGLALDLAQITPVPMTAVLTLSYLVRFLPRCSKTLRAISPVLVYFAVVNLLKKWDLQPPLGLMLGGVCGVLIPGVPKTVFRRGETGIAQVRLEMAAGVLQQTRSLLMETDVPPVDEDALMYRGTERACNGCSYRKNCRDSKRLTGLPSVVLHKPLISVEELPIICRKSGRVLAELHRCQEQLRSIHADRERQMEYRAAVVQQYSFLSSFLQELADRLPRRAETAVSRYTPKVRVFSNRPKADSGDRCVHFAGVGCKYYVLLCDGMGTGLGAVQEGKTAAGLLQKMLTAGFPAPYALRSLNSLCALRGRGGAVTVDLAEIELSSGKLTLYKWGAPPSYITGKYGAEKLGASTPPPGLSVTLEQERAEHSSLKGERLLLMVSDGVTESAAFRCCMDLCGQPEQTIAEAIMFCEQMNGQDDATVIAVRLE
ncbi:MAG: SpoIIE family protein phosphatase [Oscillospiraceae bacterium]|nr:SpoIIE family protein phosphatase [Oscillospiraceae bacterium]